LLVKYKEAKRVSSYKELADIAEGLLKKTGIVGICPTPIKPIVDYTKLEPELDLFSEENKNAFLEKFYRLGGKIEEFSDAIKKIIGAIDRRERIYYVDPTIEKNSPRKKRIVLHEASHDIIPWQKKLVYFDSSMTLNPDVERIFEAEANYLAVELLLQGKRFSKESRDYSPSIYAAKRLANKYGASFHVGIRKYVETHNKPCILLVYNDDDTDPEDYWYHVISRSFKKKYFRSGILDYQGMQEFIEEAMIIEEYENLEDKITVKENRNKIGTFLCQAFNTSYSKFVFVVERQSGLIRPRKIVKPVFGFKTPDDIINRVL
jgi:hypothetical protein